MVTPPGARGQTGGMETLHRLLEPLAAYPRWLVAACLLLAAIAAGWLLAKLAKWAVVLVVTVALVAAAVLLAAWLLG